MTHDDLDMANLQSALNTYNAQYNNSTYLQLEYALTDFFNSSVIGEKTRADDKKVVTFLNQVINATLDICGSTYFAGGKRLLAFQIAYEEMPDRLYTQIEEYLQPFANPDSTTILDFRATYCTFRDAFEAQDMAESAARECSAIHGWQGQMAHTLLYAAFHAILAACTILNSMDNNARDRIAYARQKINSATRNIEHAFETGRTLSKYPGVFVIPDNAPQGDD